MTTSPDTFCISIRHTLPDEVAVEITDRITGIFSYNTVKVKELDLDKLEQELLVTIRAFKAKNRDDWGDIYRLTKDSTNPWLKGNTNEQ